jgi:hypothetical protein
VAVILLTLLVTAFVGQGILKEWGFYIPDVIQKEEVSPVPT